MKQLMIRQRSKVRRNRFACRTGSDVGDSGSGGRGVFALLNGHFEIRGREIDSRGIQVKRGGGRCGRSGVVSVQLLLVGGLNVAS
jgi:hypothetical protein